MAKEKKKKVAKKKVAKKKEVKITPEQRLARNTPEFDKGAWMREQHDADRKTLNKKLFKRQTGRAMPRAAELPPPAAVDAAIEGGEDTVQITKKTQPIRNLRTIKEDSLVPVDSSFAETMTEDFGQIDPLGLESSVGIEEYDPLGLESSVGIEEYDPNQEQESTSLLEDKGTRFEKQKMKEGGKVESNPYGWPSFDSRER